MKILFFVTSILFLLPAASFAQTESVQSSCAPWLDQSIQQLHTEQVIDLCAETAGKTVLLVNTASYCGYTYQFTDLERLYQRYKDEGFVIIGFPSNSFNQEDSNAANTAEVCYVNHGVTFLMTEAIDVTGSGAHPVFRHLAAEKRQPTWNFNKYLIDRNGQVLEHFTNQVEPDDTQILRAIEALL